MSTLNKREMAALTSQVPVSGDAGMDSVIRASLRLKTATQLLEGLLASGTIVGMPAEEAATIAVQLADALFSTIDGKGSG